MVWIENVFYPAHEVEVPFAEYDIHISFLYQSDAVLPADRTPEAVHQFEKGPEAFHHPRIFLAVGAPFLFYTDVQITVSRMTIANGVEPILAPQRLYAPDQGRQCCPGDHRI